MAEERLKGETYADKEYIQAAETRVRYRQEFHIKGLYMMLHDWFVHEGWFERKDDADWPEPYYLLRENPERGNEMWFWWRFKKSPQLPERAGDSKYYQFNLDIFWHVMGIKDIEVMKQGNKFKTNTADLELVLRGRVELDFKGTFKKNKLIKNIHDMFRERIMKTAIEKKRDELYREVYKLQETIKTFLGMKKYMTITEGHEFWPTLGSGDKEGLLPNQ